MHRIIAIMLRHWYNFIHSPDRLTDAFFWPSLDMVLWGLTILALTTRGMGSNLWIASVVFGAVLWYFVWRGQSEMTIGLLEELWSENLINIFASPLKFGEWVIGLCGVAIVKIGLTTLLEALLVFLLYQVNFFGLGWYLVPFALILTLMSWAFGFFVTGMILRYGTNIQTLAWSGIYILSPLSAVYYPLSILPEWLHYISGMLPSTYVFEAMRLIVSGGTLSPEWMVKPLILNLIYLALGLWFITRSFAVARNKGLGHLQ